MCMCVHVCVHTRTCWVRTHAGMSVTMFLEEQTGNLNFPVNFLLHPWVRRKKVFIACVLGLFLLIFFWFYFYIFSDLLFYSSPTSNLQDLWGWDPRGQAARFGHPSNQAESQPACPHSGDQELHEAHQGFKETTAGLRRTSFRCNVDEMS